MHKDNNGLKPQKQKDTVRGTKCTHPLESAVAMRVRAGFGAFRRSSASKIIVKGEIQHISPR